MLYLSVLARNGQLPHSLLFTGPSGIGKFLVAEIFAKMILCQSENKPCDRCSVCTQISTRSYPDFILLQSDEKNKIPIGSEDEPNSVRWLIDKLSRKAIHGRYVAIIDGITSISEAGQNALLKTIEEPSSGSIIILIADNKSGILPTIISRCIEITFKPLPYLDVEEIIREKHPARNDYQFLAKISGGSPGKALKLCEGNVLDSIISMAEEISRYINGKNLLLQNISFPPGSDADFFLTILINLYSLILAGSIKGETLPLSNEIFIDQESAAKVIKILLAVKQGLKNNLNPVNSLKGMIYSLDQIRSVGFVEPYFGWIDI